jgi:hypothetical protein
VLTDATGLADAAVGVTSARGDSPVGAARAAVPGKRRIVGAGEVRSWPDGSTRRVPARALVTPAAQDMARARGITIIREEG